MRVAEYVRREMERLFIPGETDCCNTADRWVRLNHGFSPLERFGRPVTSTQDVEDWLAERWGIVGGVLRVMRASGLPRAEAPQAGDVGLVRVKDQICMAIFTGTFWFSRNEQGCILAKADVLRAWSV